MSKGQDKQVRPPVNTQSGVNKLEDAEKERIAFGRQSILDAEYYVRLPEYAGMKFRWFDDSDGSLERAMDLGMLLTPVRKDRIRNKGLHGDVSEWERKAVGAAKSGATIFNYLCHMPEDEYQKYFLDPNIKRQSDIDTAMGMGNASTEGRQAGGDLPTYAAKADTAGFNAIK